MYLGNGEERLGDVDDAAHLRNIVDPVLDGLGVVGASGVQDVPDPVVVGLRPFLIHRTTELDQRSPDAQKSEGNDGLLVDDVVLIADGVDGQTGGGGKDSALGDEGATGKSIDEGLRLSLGIDLRLRDVGRGSGGDKRADGRKRSRSDGGAETGSPYDFE